MEDPVPTVQAPPEPPEPLNDDETRYPKRRIAALWARRGGVDHDLMVMLSTAWNRFVGDVLANVLLYLGVLLATASIFAFFALGHFGDVVTNADMRPIVFAAVPLNIFGVSRICPRFSFRQEKMSQEARDEDSLLKEIRELESQARRLRNCAHPADRQRREFYQHHQYLHGMQ